MDSGNDGGGPGPRAGERLVVVGAGDVGGQVARLWVRRGGVAVGITRTPTRHPELRAWGVEPSTDDPATVIRPGDRLLLSTPGSRTQAETASRLGGVPAARAVLTGSTGFYGTPRGRVDESTPAGAGPRAESAARAESAFRETVPHGTVLRLGGLYRRGRGPLQPLLRRGAPPEGPPDAALPLIHRDDAVAAILAALVHPRPASIYLAVTPPAPRRDTFYREACRRHGLAEPLFGEPLAPDPAPARRREEAAATYDVGRLRRDLLPEPAHPDWRDAVEG